MVVLFLYTYSKQNIYLIFYVNQMIVRQIFSNIN